MKTKKTIKSESAFLKHFIQNANEFGEVDITKAFPSDILSPLDLHDYIKSLSQKNYIQYVDFQHYRLTPYGRNAYVPVHKKILKMIFTGTKVTLREVISFFLGVLSAIVIAVALHWLGLD